MSDDDNNDVRRSGRSRESRKATTRRSALEAMKEARQSGKGYKPNIEVKDVYEVVEESEYNDIVSQRQNDDFVVDDDGMGYVDTGADFEEEYEDEEDSKSKKKDKKKKDKKQRRGALDSFFNASSTKKVKDETKVKLEDDDDLKNMLDDVLGDDLEEEEVLKPKPTPRNVFKRERTESPESFEPRPMVKKLKVKRDVKKAEPEKKQEILKKVEVVKEEPEEEDDHDYGAPDFDSFEETPPVVSEFNTKIDIKEEKAKVVESKVSESVPAPVPESSGQFVASQEQWEADTNEEDTSDQKPIEVGNEMFYVSLENDKQGKAVKMYWIDAFEDVHKNTGTVYLFGKVNEGGNSWKSCCLVVKNIMRQIFFLPRATKRSDPEIAVTDVDVFNDITNTLHKHLNTTNFKCRKIQKNLTKDKAFGDSIGGQVDLMEVLYSSTFPKIQSDTTGETFSKIFNTTTTPLERLLVEKKFKGPGWIQFTQFTPVTSKTTFCDYEFQVDMEKMKTIEYLGDSVDQTVPLLRMTSIHVMSTVNEKRENEICMVSMLYNPKFNMAHPSAEPRSLQRKCLVSRPSNGSLPFDIKKVVEDQKLAAHVQTVANEKALLTVLLARLNEMEPDLIVGHDLQLTLATLAARLDKHKIPNWSRISRLRRSININKLTSKSAQWELTAGRMMLDSRSAAMELVKARSYDLTELAATILLETRKELYENDIQAMYSNSNRLIQLISWAWNESLLALRLCVKLNALPLFTQITKIVGGIVSRTLMGGRAERNEHLLMHAFHRADLIAPDKYQPSTNKKAPKKEEESIIEGAEEQPKNGGKAKAQYSGGLVLEPKKGLYETLILLLDFNSLYPSIIQEYNICFTTVAHEKNGDELPILPDAKEQKEGVLPCEIRKLVERRRDVKKLMKSSRNEAEKKQLDIRQLALKLTANSMYGCLGFQYSRFYAKPLAAVITAKGREILMNSKNLVEKLGHSVVYGDTDSIMIDTNSGDLAVAKKLGFEIKKQVNRCYKLLELELDGVFKRLLLLKKKKYAALTVDLDTEAVKKELKGLDIVRRDWSQVAKDTGLAVVDKLLNPDLTREKLAMSINELLTAMREQLDAGIVSIERFQISKQLTRNPKDYADLKSQPHASVAARLNGTGRFHFRQGDIVEYVICEDGTAAAATQRAYHKTELEGNKELKIDVNYYLSQQIHPVVSRLCEPIEEVDAISIAESLGMDPSGFKRSAAAALARNAESDEMVKEIENFDTCVGFIVDCPNKACGQKTIVRSAFDDQMSPSLWGCTHCQTDFYTNKYRCVLFNSIERQLASFVQQQLNSQFKCDEPTCDFKSQIPTLKWCREGLECPQCDGGILRREYTARELYNQQMFFAKIFNINAAMAEMPFEKTKEIRSQKGFNLCKIFYEEAAEIVEEYLKKNAYSRVDLAFLFAPMCKKR